MNGEINQDRRGQGAVVVLLGALYVLLFFRLGFHARPSADDYSFLNAVADLGFIALQKIYYLQWTGRVFNTFLLSLAASSDIVLFYGFLPLLTGSLYFLALRFCLGVFVPGRAPGDRTAKALLLQAASLSVLPALNETFYWLSGMPYTWTAALSLLVLALAVGSFRGDGSEAAFWGCIVLLFLNGTLLEPTSVMQILLAFLAVLYFRTLGEVRKAKRAAVFLFVALLAFLVMLLAPGTSARMGGVTAVAFLPRLFKTFGVAAVFGAFTAIKFFSRPIVYVLLLFLPSIVQTAPPLAPHIASRLKAWHIGLLTVLIAPLMQAVAGWATGAGLPDRAESLTVWLMGASWVLLWSFGYRQEAVIERVRASRLFRWRWALLASCLLLSPNFIALIEDLRVAPAYRAGLEARDERVMRQKEAGCVDVVVPFVTVRPKLLFFSDLRPWPSDWKNQAYAQYCGVGSVSALPSRLCRGDGVASRVPQEVVEGLEQMAGKGDVRAQFLMGELYDTTFAPVEGVVKDDALAAEWYLAAAARGDVHARRRLSRLYALGKGVPKSHLKAVCWLARAQF